ncbi:hypothetical protein [Nocardioides silvaticus]|uniref:hypothetical protein n=1 Tax=Nocardioides silvaticus TaxID=2201891 RepID=UPI001304E4AF|nr:hypothetical protein [Nocardioides silvaticus]
MTEEHPQSEGRPTVEPPGIPGWVKGLAIGLVVVVALVILVMVLSGGQHGPGMHG